MKKVTLNDFTTERIEENSNLFTAKEIEYINANKECINKIYLLGFINSRECYENKTYNS